ncbi:hypothetical protein NEAUS03_1448 [Nematocida ausubeli]|nr:hypothetical protein NEAUS03_1448 [Nematocida ausubeli]
MAGSAVAAESKPVLETPQGGAAAEKENMAAPDKKEPTVPEKKKEEVPKPKKEDTDVLNPSKGMGRKHITIGENLYYIVSVDEVNRYMDLKTDYKTDSMKAFIVYMHEEFVSDLKNLRKKRSLKKGAFFLIALFVLIGVALLGVMFLRK